MVSPPRTRSSRLNYVARSDRPSDEDWSPRPERDQLTRDTLAAAERAISVLQDRIRLLEDSDSDSQTASSIGTSREQAATGTARTRSDFVYNSVFHRLAEPYHPSLRNAPRATGSGGSPQQVGQPLGSANSSTPSRAMPPGATSSSQMDRLRNLAGGVTPAGPGGLGGPQRRETALNQTVGDTERGDESHQRQETRREGMTRLIHEAESRVAEIGRRVERLEDFRRQARDRRRALTRDLDTSASSLTLTDTEFDHNQASYSEDDGDELLGSGGHRQDNHDILGGTIATSLGQEQTHRNSVEATLTRNNRFADMVQIPADPESERMDSEADYRNSGSRSEPSDEEAIRQILSPEASHRYSLMERNLPIREGTGRQQQQGEEERNAEQNATSMVTDTEFGSTLASPDFANQETPDSAESTVFMEFRPRGSAAAAFRLSRTDIPVSLQTTDRTRVVVSSNAPNAPNAPIPQNRVLPSIVRERLRGTRVINGVTEDNRHMEFDSNISNVVRQMLSQSTQDTSDGRLESFHTITRARQEIQNFDDRPNEGETANEVESSYRLRWLEKERNGPQLALYLDFIWTHKLEKGEWDANGDPINFAAGESTSDDNDEVVAEADSESFLSRSQVTAKSIEPFCDVNKERLIGR